MMVGDGWCLLNVWKITMLAKQINPITTSTGWWRWFYLAIYSFNQATENTRKPSYLLFEHVWKHWCLVLPGIVGYCNWLWSLVGRCQNRWSFIPGVSSLSEAVASSLVCRHRLQVAPKKLLRIDQWTIIEPAMNHDSPWTSINNKLAIC